MQSFSDFIRECGMSHDVPPSHDIQTWIAENRSTYQSNHGKHEGERLLMGEAWQSYNSINTNNENLKQQDSE